MIPKIKLEHGEYYAGQCRNATVGRWHAGDQKFYHWRHKFGTKFVETICHPDDEKTYDVFTPNTKIDYGTEEIPFK